MTFRVKGQFFGADLTVTWENGVAQGSPLGLFEALNRACELRDEPVGLPTGPFFQAGDWRNPEAAKIGWAPRDTSEPFRAAVEARQPVPDPNDVQNRYHGGKFTQDGPFEDRRA